MTLELANELWNELKRYISVVDRTDAAYAVVAALVDYDFDPADIRTAFKSDSDIKMALREYADEEEEQLEEDDDDEDQEDEE